MPDYLFEGLYDIACFQKFPNHIRSLQRCPKAFGGQKIGPFIRAAIDDEMLTLHGLWNDIAAGGLEVYDGGGFVAL